MSNTRRDRRSYSLFKGNDGRSTLCDMVANLESDLEDAKAENTRLREVVTDGEMHAQEILTENAKMRELLQRLLTEYRYMRVRPRAMYLQHEERMRVIEEEMRKLEIEVN